MNTQKRRQKGGFLAFVIERIDQKVRERIEAELSVIHPDYRDAAYIAIRHMSAENLMTGKSPEEQQAIIKLLVRFWALSANDEAQMRVRAHALSIAQDALELRRQEIERAKSGLLPRLMYINTTVKRASKRPGPTLRRVV